MPIWLIDDGPEHDVAVSSRVRLARNFADAVFPSRLDEAAGKRLFERTKSLMAPMKALLMSDLSDIERSALVERHLASPALSANTRHGALLFGEDESCSVMINEEDHLRLQCLLPGIQLEEALACAFGMEEKLGGQIEFAYDEQLGFLTCCPTNVGTGLRASAMLHLPALAMTGQLQPILQAVGKMGLAVRGIYGEGSEALGNMLQVSNQVTLGASEEDIVRVLAGVTRQIIERERKTRQALYKTKKVELEDRLFRAWALLKNARKMDTKEFMRLYSDVKLGLDMNILSEVSAPMFARLLVDAQSAAIQRRAGRQMDGFERDVARAEYLRGIFENNRQ